MCLLRVAVLNCFYFVLQVIVADLAFQLCGLDEAADVSDRFSISLLGTLALHSQSPLSLLGSLRALTPVRPWRHSANERHTKVRCAVGSINIFVMPANSPCIIRADFGRFPFVVANSGLFWMQPMQTPLHPFPYHAFLVDCRSTRTVHTHLACLWFLFIGFGVVPRRSSHTKKV